jgi:RNA polymerase sigma factor (sigma-70 family)
MTEDQKYLLLILAGCKQGQLNSQRSLYEHFYGYGLSIALRYAQNREEAVEILNDAFLKVFVKLDQYKTEQPFKPWFRRILIHTAIDYHRVHHKFPTTIDIDLVTQQLIDSDASLAFLSPHEDVLPLVQALPPQYRLVFNLYVMEEYDHKHIAAQLGITESTSRANLARAKEKLKDMIHNQSPQNGQLAYKKYSN